MSVCLIFSGVLYRLYYTYSLLLVELWINYFGLSFLFYSVCYVFLLFRLSSGSGLDLFFSVFFCWCCLCMSSFFYLYPLLLVWVKVHLPR